MWTRLWWQIGNQSVHCPIIRRIEHKTHEYGQGPATRPIADVLCMEKCKKWPLEDKKGAELRSISVSATHALSLTGTWGSWN